MITRLLYKARATHPSFTYHDLDILREGMARNVNRHIQSFLLRSDRLYFQILEGPGNEVRALAEEIARDPRLFAYEELLHMPVRERLLAGPSMDMHMLTPEDRALEQRLSKLNQATPKAIKLAVLREMAALAHDKMAAVA
jgi:hypothetical protein